MTIELANGSECNDGRLFFFGRYFSTIAYSADGETLLAAGKSKNVCIYNVASGILLKKLEITQNHSLDGLDVSIHLTFDQQG